ncbi:MAG: ferric reductase-like transmembrane domain-containing protein [Chromatiales bacterium]|jgi:predicted ferric reductase
MKFLNRLFVVFLLTMPGGIWYRQTGDIGFYFSEGVPDGQLIYVLSKLAGLYALLFIAMQMIAALPGYSGNPLRRWQGRSHRLTGIVIICLAVAHLMLFFAAVSIRQDAPALGMFLPSFEDYYHTRLAFGLFALWLLLIVMVAGIMRFRSKAGLARWVHKLYWVAIVLVYLHALAVGTEAQTRAGLLFYGLLGLIVAFLFIASLLRRPGARRAYTQ